MINIKYIYNWDNKMVNEYTISNGKYKFSAINIGAALTKVIVPNMDNKLENITLRYHDYQLYQENKYLLGCLIDYQKFKEEKKCALNYYFDCTFNDYSLTFMYKNGENYFKVKYSLIDSRFDITYDSNVSISQAIYWNLTGNIKGDIIGHKMYLNSYRLKIKESLIDYFKQYRVDGNILLQLLLEDNEVEIKLTSNNQDIHLSFGKYFNEGFLINKKILAKVYSGIGIVVGLDKLNNNVSYQFR